ncbi:MAG: RuvX/YqgF family protein [Candidatus Paceibacterota bacterium]|jgi:putative Holliday junction resolvase
MRLLAIDYGEKRLGIALSDDKGMMAFPHSVLPRSRDFVEKIADIARQNAVDIIVMGDSKNYAGERNPIMKGALECADALKVRGFRVELELELLSSHQASHFQGKTAMTDAAAASIILQSYIDRMKK